MSYIPFPQYKVLSRCSLFYEKSPLCIVLPIMDQPIAAPRLIETSIKSALYQTLNKCHDIRVKYYSIFFNVAIFVIFVGVFGAALYFCYKRKMTPEEQYQKMVMDQQYILSKIRFYQNERVDHPLSAITSLPKVEENIMERLRV